MSSGIKRSRSSSPQDSPELPTLNRRHRSMHNTISQDSYTSNRGIVFKDDLQYLVSGLSAGSLVSRTNCLQDLMRMLAYNPTQVAAVDKEGRCVHALTSVMTLLVSQMGDSNSNINSIDSLSDSINGQAPKDRDHLTRPVLHTEQLASFPLLYMYLYCVHACSPHMSLLPSTLAFQLQIGSGDIMLVPPSSQPVAHKWFRYLQETSCCCSSVQRECSETICTVCNKKKVQDRIPHDGVLSIYKHSEVVDTVHSVRLYALYVAYQAVSIMSKSPLSPVLAQWQRTSPNHTKCIVTSLQQQNVLLQQDEQTLSATDTMYRTLIGAQLCKVIALFQHVLFLSKVPLTSSAASIESSEQVTLYTYLGGGTTEQYTTQAVMLEQQLLAIKQNPSSSVLQRDLTIRTGRDSSNTRVLLSVHAMSVFIWQQQRQGIQAFPSFISQPPMYARLLQDVTASLLFCTESCPASVQSMHASGMHSLVFIPALSLLDCLTTNLELTNPQSSVIPTLYIVLRQMLSCLQYDGMYGMRRYSEITNTTHLSSDDETSFAFLANDIGYLNNATPVDPGLVVCNGIDRYSVTMVSDDGYKSQSLYKCIYSLVQRYCDFEQSSPSFTSACNNQGRQQHEQTNLTQRRQIVCEATLLLGVYLSKNPTCQYSLSSSSSSSFSQQPLIEIMHAYYSILVAIQKLENQHQSHRAMFVRQIFQLLEQYHSTHTDRTKYIEFATSVFLTLSNK